MTEELDKKGQFPADEDPIEEALRAARVHQRAGRAKETAAVLSKVLRVDPNNVEALTGMAEIASISDQPTASLPFYAKILHFEPDNKDALNNRGVILMNIGDAEASEFSFRKLLKFYPEDIDGLNNLGTNLIAQRRYDEAKIELERAVRIDPQQPKAFYNLGVLKMQSEPGNKKQQMEYFLKAIEIDPDYADAHSNLASIYSSLEENDRALMHIDRVLLVRPNDAINLFNKGLILRKRRDFSNAIACFKTARQLFPEPHIVDHEMGQTHYESGDLKSASAFFLLSVSERLSFSKGFLSLGKTFAEMGQVAKAKEAFRQAGNVTEAKQRLHHLDLVTGDEIPWKHLKTSFDEIFKNTGSPSNRLWQGETLKSKLVVHTAGIREDEILLFIRLLPALQTKCQDIALVVRASMRLLISRVIGVDQVLEEENFDEKQLNSDVKITHIHSLPQLLGIEDRFLPDTDRYLYPDTARERPWDINQHSNNRLNIGLFWTNTNIPTGPLQEFRFEEYEPIVQTEGANFIGLAKPVDKLQKDHLRDLDVGDIGSVIRDTEDLAAAIDGVDLLITSDSLAAHISGALAKPTILLLPLLPNWYWGYKETISSHYKTIVIMRQSAANNWDRPVQKTLTRLVEQYDLRVD